MSKNINYGKIGFKAGLEIHQQLDTGKLFCSCPGVLRQDEPLFEVKRKLHAVAGESGEVDSAAKFQSSLSKEFIYQAYDTTCLVELDEEPPHRMNSEALKVAMQIALLFNCKILPLSQVMRKTVINGSNTSGFQRTVMFARDGYIETSKGRVGINSLFLEEDSARPVTEDDNSKTYRLDRLGIPLVEVTTDPDLVDAEHVKEAALIIGDILRSCKVRRGIGTIRQDLNISISGSNRVEIKGFQDPKIMVKTVDLEIERQQMYLDLVKTKFEAGKTVDVTSILTPELDWMKEKVNSGESLVAFKLNSFNGLLGKKEGANVWLGNEIKGVCRPRGFNGVIHSDEEMEKYKFDSNELDKLRKELDMKDDDAFMILVGNKERAEAVIKEVVFPFLVSLKDANPKEVRNCLANGTTEFIRPMPGSARMYPETDLELLRLKRDYIDSIKKDLPELRSVIEERMKKEGLTEDMITILFKRNKFDDFKAISEAVKMPKVIGKVLLLLPREIATKTGKTLEEVEEILDVDKLTFILEELSQGKIEESDLKEVLEKVVSGSTVVDAVKIEKADMSAVEDFVKKVIGEKPGLRPNAYMGLVMKEFGGKVQAGQVMGIINKAI